MCDSVKVLENNDNKYKIEEVNINGWILIGHQKVHFEDGIN